jgi:hypothetical protein
MDEFVRGLELLLEADAGKLLIVGGLVFLVGTGVMVFLMLRLVYRLSDRKQQQGVVDDRFFDLFVRFTGNIETSVMAQAEVIETFAKAQAEVNESLKGATLQLVADSKAAGDERAQLLDRQDVLDVHMNQIDAQIVDLINAVRELPDQIRLLADKTPDRTELMSRIDELEARLIERIEMAIASIKIERDAEDEANKAAE